MSQAILEQVQQSQIKQDLPVISVGDTVDVHYRIIEGAKERVQVFAGVVIARSGKAINDTITVRRIVANQGVERVFPVHSPKVAKIEVKRHGQARRAKLYYLRDRVGKARRLKDRRRGFNWLEREKQAVADAQAQRAAEAQAAEDKAAAEE